MQLLLQHFWEIIIAVTNCGEWTNPSIDKELFLAFALPKSELPRINLAIKILGSSDVSVLQDLEAMHSQVLATRQVGQKCNTNKKGKQQPQPWKKPLCHQLLVDPRRNNTKKHRLSHQIQNSTGGNLLMRIQCLDAVVHQQIRIYQVGIQSYFLTFRPSHSFFPQVNNRPLGFK